ncbi:MAG: hypothetical protein IMW90_05370 [Thermogemmatispora sp.]|jgi:hypothetical protein|uniref:Uncharacterized protein n=1 Tax=Thermogemmatispora aurantia TaxID=2045279 RepID=A0A5J4K146_9CHLR|nr:MULTISPECIES: hypothetical protein [Thermogemmatispora]MBE3565139.1 hypothetical protein [Thermogemmatispora sp.]GER82734.1 hypothetical protein KTAU_13710 [Thermogemmatispora aurantia]
MSDVNHDPEQLHSEAAQESDGHDQTDGEAAVSEAAPQASAGETVASQPAPVEAAMPEWETNGGPLGCCLGVTVGLLLSLCLPVAVRLAGSPLSDFFNGALLRVMMALAAVVAAIICGYFGWKIGRRLYREYELSPRQRRRLEELERKYAQRQRRHP